MAFTAETVTSLMSEMDDMLVDAFTTTEDYDENYQSFMCDKSSVREFRASLEPPLFWIIAVLGGVGNLAVVWIYLHFRQRLKTMTDVYLLNLAVADLLFLGTLPLWAADATHGWSFGSGGVNMALCKVNLALYKINLYSSMFLLTCISADRYVVIVQTTKAQNSKRQRLLCSKLVCAGVWWLAVLLATPEFIFGTTKEEGGRDNCRLVYPTDEGNPIKILVLSLQVSMGFCLPFLVMVFCYSKIICTLLNTRNFEKHKALRVILVVVAVFVLSQLPYTGVLVMEATQAVNITLTDCEETKRFDVVGQVLKCLAYTHACLNPFLYAFVGVRFRRDVVKLLQTYHCWPSRGKLGKAPGGSMRASVMSDTDTTQALSL